jgi:hypothetical protein
MPRSSHQPNEWVGELTITGEAVVRTDLSRIKHVSLSFKLDNFSPNEESKLSWYPYAPEIGAFVIRVEKGGSNEGSLGDNPVVVSYRAYAE